jgi:RING-like zinc finger
VIIVAVLVFVALRFRVQLCLQFNSLGRRLRTDEGTLDIEQTPRANKPHILDFIPVNICKAVGRSLTQGEKPNNSDDVDMRRISEVPDGERTELRLPMPPPKVKRLSGRELDRRVPNEHNILICCICVQPILEGENVRMLPCDHLYHGKRVDNWLTTYSDTCPLWYFQALTIW